MATAIDATATKHEFAALLVLEARGTDGREAQHSLRQSRRHGELSINVAQQTVTFVYPKHGKHLFKRTFPQPLQCVASTHVLHIHCSRGTRSFMYDDVRDAR